MSKSFNWAPLIKMASLGLISFVICSGCQQLSSGAPPPETVQQVDYAFQSIALLPVQFTSSKPKAMCHEDIGDDLRSALARVLKKKGYQVQSDPDMRPLSFALDPPAPPSGTAPLMLAGAPAGIDTALGLWVDNYVDITLCDPREPAQLEMGVLAILYALPEGRELGRWHGSSWQPGSGDSDSTVWFVTSDLADQLLVGIPRRR